MSIDPQLRRVLDRLGREGSIYVPEVVDPDDEAPGLRRAVDLGFAQDASGGPDSVPRFVLTRAGREAIGLPPMFSWGSLLGRLLRR